MNTPKLSFIGDGITGSGSMFRLGGLFKDEDVVLSGSNATSDQIAAILVERLNEIIEGRAGFAAERDDNTMEGLIRTHEMNALKYMVWGEDKLTPTMTKEVLTIKSIVRVGLRHPNLDQNKLDEIIDKMMFDIDLLKGKCERAIRAGRDEPALEEAAFFLVDTLRGLALSDRPSIDMLWKMYYFNDAGIFNNLLLNPAAPTEMKKKVEMLIEKTAKTFSPPHEKLRSK